ncbi:MAG: aminodeoxychorismate lyase [Pseudomonadota bacterium]
MLTALLNGRPVDPADQPVNSFGDGLFETIAIRQGQPCLWTYHLQRLQRGCHRLGIPFPQSDQLLAEANQLTSSHAQAVLRIVLSVPPSHRGYQRPADYQPDRYLSCHPWPEQPLYHAVDFPIHLQTCQTRLGSQPLLAGIKHLNRLEQILARRELRLPAVEGVMCDQQGQVVEGTMSNFLVLQETGYITPPINTCGIAGVVRQLVLGTAAQQAISVREATFSLAELRQAKAVYVMNSLLGVRPVAALNGQVYPAAQLPDFLQQVHQACFELTSVNIR